MAHIRQSPTDSGLDFEAQVIKTFSAVPSLLGSDLVTPDVPAGWAWCLDFEAKVLETLSAVPSSLGSGLVTPDVPAGWGGCRGPVPADPEHVRRQVVRHVHAEHELPRRAPRLSARAAPRPPAPPPDRPGYFQTPENNYCAKL